MDVDEDDDQINEVTDDEDTDMELDDIERQEMQDRLLQYNYRNMEREQRIEAERVNQEILDAAAFNEIEATVRWMEVQERIQQEERALEERIQQEEMALQRVERNIQQEIEEDNQRARAREEQQRAMEAFFQREKVEWFGMLEHKIYNYYLVQQHEGTNRILQVGEKVSMDDIESNNIQLEKVVRRAVMLKRKGFRNNNNNNFQKTLKIGMIVYESMHRDSSENNNMVNIYFSIQQDDMTVEILQSGTGYAMTQVPRNFISPMPELGWMDKGIDKIIGGCKNYSTAKDASGKNIVIGRIPNSATYAIGTAIVGLFSSRMIYDITKVGLELSGIWGVNDEDCYYVTDDLQKRLKPGCLNNAFTTIRSTVGEQCKLLEESWFSFQGIIAASYLAFRKVRSGSAATLCDAVTNRSKYQLFLSFVNHAKLATFMTASAFQYNETAGLIGNLYNLRQFWWLQSVMSIVTGAAGLVSSIIESLLKGIAAILKHINETVATMIEESTYIGSLCTKGIMWGMVKLFQWCFNSGVPATPTGIAGMFAKLESVASMWSPQALTKLLVVFLGYLIYFDFLLFMKENLCWFLLYGANQLENCKYNQPKPKKKSNELHREMLDSLVKLKF